MSQDKLGKNWSLSDSESFSDDDFQNTKNINSKQNKKGKSRRKNTIGNEMINTEDEKKISENIFSELDEDTTFNTIFSDINSPVIQEDSNFGTTNNEVFNNVNDKSNNFPTPREENSFINIFSDNEKNNSKVEFSNNFQGSDIFSEQNSINSNTSQLSNAKNSQEHKNISKFSSWDSERKSAEYERLSPFVDQVLRIAGSDVDTQKTARDLILTTNIGEDYSQKNIFLDILRLKVAGAGINFPNPDDSTAIYDIVYDEILGISVLGDLWRDDQITEIMVDRWDKISVEKNGKLYKTNIKFKNKDHANSVARNLAIRISDRALSSSIPLVTAELPNARVTFAMGSVVKGGLSITLRKFRKLLSLENLINNKSLNNEMVDFLREAVSFRAGILVSGGTGTGKTTIINLLSTFIPASERVVTIEDAFELNINTEHVVSLQTKEASSRDDQIEVTMADLLRNTLRMRPDRIIVGEIREGEGANVMLAAANTGHEGTMTTIHASSCSLALNERLVDLVRSVRNSPDDAIKRTIVEAFDIVIQVTRGRKGQRYISEISVVDRKYVKNNEIIPRPIFIGEELPSGDINHKKLGFIESDTTLGFKMSLSENYERWNKS